MSRFIVAIAQYGTNPNVQCFLEIARATAYSLRQLGHEVAGGTVAEAYRQGGRLIIFGSNNLIDDKNAPLLAPDTIIYNAEQLAAVADPAYFIQNFVQYRELKVWEYAESNAMVAREKLGMQSVMCPVGYAPMMSNIEPVDEDIDVLFYGSIAGPRREILDALDDAGLNVVRLFNVWGEERDAAIARAKVVVNLHFYPNGVFEIFRVSHLLANRKCVVTEAGGCDDGLESFASRACAYVPRASIVEECRRLVGDRRARADIAERGFEEFRRTSMVDNVRVALEGS